MRHERIDLSTVPSEMERLARSWGASPTPRAPRIAPKPRAQPRAIRAPIPLPASVVTGDDQGSPGFYGALMSADEVFAERQARRDAMLSIAHGVPDPAHYARRAPRVLVEALINAEWAGNGWRYRADTPAEFMAKLRGFGLAYLEADRGLTSFACAVRRVLIEDRA